VTGSPCSSCSSISMDQPELRLSFLDREHHATLLAGQGHHDTVELEALAIDSQRFLDEQTATRTAAREEAARAAAEAARAAPRPSVVTTPSWDTTLSRPRNVWLTGAHALQLDVDSACHERATRPAQEHSRRNNRGRLTSVDSQVLWSPRRGMRWSEPLYRRRGNSGYRSTSFASNGDGGGARRPGTSDGSSSFLTGLSGSASTPMLLSAAREESAYAAAAHEQASHANKPIARFVPTSSTQTAQTAPSSHCIQCPVPSAQCPH
jgi:hypothetical protein